VVVSAPYSRKHRRGASSSVPMDTCCVPRLEMATAPRARRGCARFAARSAPYVATACPARRSEHLALSRPSPPCRPDVATARAACRGGRWGRTRRCVPGRPCYARLRTAGAGGRVRGQRKMRTRRRACGVGPRHPACAHRWMCSRL
jgi:hypothetical protein